MTVFLFMLKLFLMKILLLVYHRFDHVYNVTVKVMSWIVRDPRIPQASRIW